MWRHPLAVGALHVVRETAQRRAGCLQLPLKHPAPADQLDAAQVLCLKPEQVEGVEAGARLAVAEQLVKVHPRASNRSLMDDISLAHAALADGVAAAVLPQVLPFDLRADREGWRSLRLQLTRRGGWDRLDRSTNNLGDVRSSGERGAKMAFIQSGSGTVVPVAWGSVRIGWEEAGRTGSRPSQAVSTSPWSTLGEYST